MHVFMEIGPMKAFLKHHRSLHNSIGLVPTMGALHAGHLSLVVASKRENNLTVSTIFVNPAQFNNAADLAKYPRTLEEDISKLKLAGCDAVFCPDEKEMYGENDLLKFDFGRLANIFEGEFRPGHFSGVGIVVSKIFNIIRPDRAYFGQKDFQQFRIISALVENLKFDIQLVCMPTTREPDGLAMSSRNLRLSKSGRQRAVALSQALIMGRERLLQGDSTTEVRNGVVAFCERQAIRLEYFALVDKENFEEREHVENPVNGILLIAGYVDDVRLIDNLLLVEK